MGFYLSGLKRENSVVVTADMSNISSLRKWLISEQIQKTYSFENLRYSGIEEGHPENDFHSWRHNNNQTIEAFGSKFSQQANWC